MIPEVPMSRVETYLAKILGQDVELPVPQTRSDLFWANLAGGTFALPVPQSREEIFLAKLLGEDLELPTPQSRVELFLAQIIGLDVITPEPESREELYLAQWAEDSGWVTLGPDPVVSFTAYHAKALQSLIVSMPPRQDLHGYDYPWPGGGGVNLYPLDLTAIKAMSRPGTWDGNSYTQNGVTFTFNVDDGGNVESIVLKGTATASISFDVKNGYKLPYGDYYPRCEQYDGMSVALQMKATESSSPAAITCRAYSDTSYHYTGFVDGLVWIYISNGFVSDNRVLHPLLVTADNYSPSIAYSPWSNYCPIGGYDGLTAYDDPEYVGVVNWNQRVVKPDLSGDIYTGTSSSATVSDGVATLTSNGTGVSVLTQTHGGTTPANHVCFFSWDIMLDPENTVEFATATVLSVWTGGAKSFDSPPKGTWGTLATVLKPTQSFSEMTIYPYGTTNPTPAGQKVHIRNPVRIDVTQLFGEAKAEEIFAMEQSEAGSGVAYIRSLFPKATYPYDTGTIMSVHEVNGTAGWKVPVTFPSPPGTVYGGELDVLTGLLTVDRATYTLTGNESWTAWSAHAYYTLTLPVAGINDNYRVSCISSMLKASSADRLYNATDASGIAVSARRVYISATDYANKSNLTGTVVCYELAEPVTYQLTAAEVQQLVGQNHVFCAEAGAEITLTYNRA